MKAKINIDNFEAVKVVVEMEEIPRDLIASTGIRPVFTTFPLDHGPWKRKEQNELKLLQ